MISVSETPPTPSEAPPALPEMPPSPPPKRFGKKLYFAIGLIAIIAVASVLVFTYVVPMGKGALVTLKMNYVTGDTMSYSLAISINGMGQSISATGTVDIEILEFDGQNYTIRERVQMQSAIQTITFKMDSAGHIVDYGNLPQETRELMSSLSSMPGFGSYFPKENVTVGENWQIPLNIQTSTYTIAGTGNYRVSEIKSVVVPAGTFDGIKIDVTATNIQGTARSYDTTINMNANLNGYVHLERGTCILLDFNVQESVTGSYSGQTISMSMTMQMTLTHYTK